MKSCSCKIPRHVAVIMDGNGRWAESRGLQRLNGHIQGVESVRKAVESSVRHGVRYLTLYVFSTENWGRPQSEVAGLMELLCDSILKETDALCCQGVAVRIIGDTEAMAPKVKEHLGIITERTAGGGKLTLVLALNYSSRKEIARAARLMAAESVDGGEDNHQDLGDYLYTSGLPDPDLLIRTSGEMRLSNFLLWQCAYSELYFTPTLWPDFDETEFDKAIEEYSRRERRYGLIAQKNID